MELTQNNYAYYCDQILNLFTDNNKMVDSGISNRLRMTIPDVNECLRIIEREYPEWFTVTPFSGGRILYTLKSSHWGEIIDFLNKGGFKARAETIKQQAEKKERRESLEVQYYELANQARLDAQADADRAKWNATLSVWAAVISAAVTVVSLYFSWLQNRH